MHTQCRSTKDFFSILEAEKIQLEFLKTLTKQCPFVIKLQKRGHLYRYTSYDVVLII